MDLGYELAAGLPFLRAQAVSRFTETFALERDSTEKDGNDIPVLVTTVVHSDVPGRFKSPTTGVSNETSGAQLMAVQRPEVHVAVGAVPDARVGDFWRCTGSTVDAALVGRRVRIEGLPSAGAVTSWRFPVSEAS